ncbi:MAG TPA: hypothetical protein VFU47_06360, partial [Armatimonadota bacterium]|nr:hypothetical protein [Armatimonadota bacterium]
YAPWSVMGPAGMGFGNPYGPPPGYYGPPVPPAGSMLAPWNPQRSRRESGGFFGGTPSVNPQTRRRRDAIGRVVPGYGR